MQSMKKINSFLRSAKLSYHNALLSALCYIFFNINGFCLGSRLTCPKSPHFRGLVIFFPYHISIIHGAIHKIVGFFFGSTSKECYVLSLKKLFVTGILQESRNLLKFSKYICLCLCLFLSSCLHAVKGTWLEPT